MMISHFISIRFGRRELMAVGYPRISSSDMVGAWEGGTRMDMMPTADLTQTEGCTVFIAWNEEKGAFYGSTKAKICPSSLRGATFADRKCYWIWKEWRAGTLVLMKMINKCGVQNGAYIFTRSTDFLD